jgi:6-phosphogluconolactonase
VFVGTTDGFVRVYTMEESDGSLSDAGALDTGDWLDFMTVGPDNRTVFVSYGGNVSATAKALTLIDSATTFGAGTHAEVDPTGRFVFVAHYNEGKMTFLPFSQAGGFGGGQEFSPGKNAHQTRVDVSGTHVYVPCLGSDYVAQYVLNPTEGSLTAATTANVAAGDGPRHMDFHPSAPVAYVLDELQSAIQVFDVAQGGTLTRRANDQVFMSLDEAFHQSSDIHVTPDGKFVYALNRQPSEVVTFRVGADHSLTRLGADPLPGMVRAFAMDPKGRYLHLGDNEGTMVALQIDRSTGELNETYSDTELGTINATLTRYLGP